MISRRLRLRGPDPRKVKFIIKKLFHEFIIMNSEWSDDNIFFLPLLRGENFFNKR